MLWSCSACWYKEAACILSLTSRAEWETASCHQVNVVRISMSPLLHRSPLILAFFDSVPTLQFTPVVFSSAVVRCFLRRRQLVGIQRSSSAHCVWSVQRPGHPPGQSRGKGVCQKRCPQQTEPSLGMALWSAPPPPFPHAWDNTRLLISVKRTV